MPQMDEQLTDQQLVELAFQYLEEDELERVMRIVRQRVANLRNVYRIRGQWFSVPHTAVRVKGHNPPCGGGKQELAEEAKVGAAALAVAAAAIDIAGGGGVAGLIAAAVIKFIFGNNTYQRDAVCVDFTTLIPAELDAQWVKDHVTVEYYIEDWQGNRQVSPGELPWAAIEPAIVPENPIIEVPVKQTPWHDGDRCKMTALFARCKNWSHTHDRRVRMDLLIDGFDGSFHDCADHTILNLEMYQDVYVQALKDADVAQGLIRDYADAIQRN